MRSQLWTEDHARHYDDRHRDKFDPDVLGPTVDFLAAVAAEAARGQEPQALELAIGTGRVATPLRQQGIAVAGIELSEPMVAKLREKAPADEIPVVIGDMSTAAAPPPGPGAYHLVYLVYNTITNLLTQDAQVDCFVNAARHLASGGALVIENFVPDLRRLPPGQLAVPFDVTDEHVGFDTFDLATQRLTSHHLRRRGDSWVRLASEHRFTWPSELDLMARIAGMELVDRVADWDRSPFEQDSRSAVSVWRRLG